MISKITKTCKTGILVTLLCLLAVQVQGQDTNQTDESANIEKTQEQVRRGLRELIECQIAKDALGIYLLNNVKHSITRNQPLRKNIIDLVDSTNICFFVKGTMEYKHFWSFICNKGDYKSPKDNFADYWEALDFDDESYVEKNLYKAGYEITFIPQWNTSKIPPTKKDRKDREYRMNISPEIPASLSEDISESELKAEVNDPIKESTITFEGRGNHQKNKKTFNKGFFAGFDYIKGLKVQKEKIEYSIVKGKDTISCKDNPDLSFSQKDTNVELKLIANNADVSLDNVTWEVDGEEESEGNTCQISLKEAKNKRLKIKKEVEASGKDYILDPGISTNIKINGTYPRYFVQVNGKENPNISVNYEQIEEIRKNAIDNKKHKHDPQRAKVHYFGDKVETRLKFFKKNGPNAELKEYKTNWKYLNNNGKELDKSQNKSYSNTISDKQSITIEFTTDYEENDETKTLRYNILEINFLRVIPDFYYNKAVDENSPKDLVKNEK